MIKKRQLFELVGVLLFLATIFFSGIYYSQQFFRASFFDSFKLVYQKILFYLPRIGIIILIFVCTKLLLKFTEKIILRYFRYLDMEKEYYSVFLLTKYLIWFVAFLAAVSIFFGNIGAWLTSLGLMGFGVTFALQKPILNFVGWITILISKTYTIGDRVNINHQRGDVTEITMMYTVMEGLLENSDELSGKTITVPNEMVLTSAVINYTKSGYFVWDEVAVEITYESNWRKGFKILEEVTQKIVTKYIEEIRPEVVKRHRNIIDLFHNLKQTHMETEDAEEKIILHHKIRQVHNDKEKAASDREKISQEMISKPLVRVALLDSAVELNVRYLTYYKRLRIIKSEIFHDFLDRVSTLKDVEIAYPHMQLVFGKDAKNLKKSKRRIKVHK